MFSTMTEQNHLQTSARRFLNALLSEGVRDLQRRHSDGGHVVTISSLVLAKSVNRPPPPRPLARPAVVQSEESPQSLAQKDRFWILCNVVCLGVAFMILSTAFIGTVDLQSSLNANQGLGTISLTSMYVISIVSNLCLPTVLIRWLGCKRTVAVCFLAYIPFIVAQLDGSSYALVPGAVLIGVALGPIHCAAGAHLQLLARCSAPRGPGVEAALLRLLSVFHVFVSLSQVWGSGVTALVLADDSLLATPNASMQATLERFCGVNFCHGDPEALRADPYLRRPSTERVQTVIKIYLLCAVAAFVLVMLGVSSLDRYKEAKDSELSGLALLTSTIRLMKKRNQLLLIPITMWGGMQKAFIEEEFTEAYVSCAWSMGSIGTVMICYGLATAATSLLAGLAGGPLLRLAAVSLATALQVALVAALLRWSHHTAHFHAYMAVAALWAVAGSVWLVHLNAQCGRLFPGEEEAGFSNFRLWDAVGFILVSGYSNFVCMRAKLYIQLVGVLLGAASYLLLEGSRLRAGASRSFEVSG